MATGALQPTCRDGTPSDLTALVRRCSRLVVLTGAGISTESGIPAYRDRGGRWLGSNPIQHAEFIADPAMRRRYWARSVAGWPAVAAASPNDGHVALAELESAGVVSLLVTQNVDRLHQQAGHREVIDLHGRLDRVKCLDCGAYEPRVSLQQRLLERNPALQQRTSSRLAPDGDAWVEEKVAGSLELPGCLHCAGVLMPDVVFFGGAVPRERVERATAALQQADALLVAGSSLMVYSGYRFCRLAHQRGIPVIVVNRGATRADDILSLKVEGGCSEVLRTLAGEIACN